MTDLRIGDCFLKLHNETLESDEIILNKAPLHIQFIRGELEVKNQHSQESTNCVTHKLEGYRNPVIFSHYSSRLSRSTDLPGQYFVRGKVSFHDDDQNAMYFIYEKYDMNFMKFMSHQHDPTEIKKVVRGFFEALCYLQDNNIMHGDLHYTNLVVINGSGFLSGGIAPKDNIDLKIDMTCIVDNMERCYFNNFKPLDEETKSLFSFIRRHKTREFLLHHPCLLTTKLKKEFCLNAVTFVQTVDAKMLSSCKLMKYCQITTKTHHGRTHHADWVQKVNMYKKVYPYFSVSDYYAGCAFTFMRFMRNVHAHAKVNYKETLVQHEEDIQSELDSLWPNALCIVHMAFFNANQWKYFG